MVHYKATPTSRADLANITNRLRKIMGMENTLYFPIIQTIELILPRVDEKFDYLIVEENELPPDTYALTYPDESLMLIRKDVYDNVCEDQGRARFTLAHEFCHYLLHDEANISFARSTNEIPAYVDPEWQANTFAAELLIPKKLIKGLSIEEIMIKCGVSKQCAEIQMKYCHNKKRKTNLS